MFNIFGGSHSHSWGRSDTYSVNYKGKPTKEEDIPHGNVRILFENGKEVDKIIDVKTGSVIKEKK